MKNLKFKKTILATLLILMWLFNGCYEFDFVTQPYTANPDSFFEVQISISTAGGYGGNGYFGILMPDGWATTDSIKYINITYNDTGYIHFSQSLTQQMALIDPPPENYHWWVGDSYAYPDCTYILDFVIFTGNQTGTFFIDYMLGGEGGGLNKKRSNDHLMIIGEPVGCFPEGFTFTDQAEIDNFQVNHPACTVIAGDVTINGDNITNLDGLDSITSIGGSLKILNNTNLTILSGLDQLDSIQGSLSIEDNESLLEISGLTNLKYIGRDFRIVNDTLLTSISLTGLGNLNAVGRDLYINSNTSLSNLSGLGNLTTIGGNLQIGYYEAGNSALTSLSGLDNLTSIGGYLDIIDNNALISLSGLDSIESASITDLTITNNSSLSTCDVQSICHCLAAPNGFIQIYGNAPGCNSPEEVEEDCNNDCLPDGINFTSQAQIDNFQTNYPGCPEIEGNVTIHGSDITNLNGLNVLTSIGGYLDIIDNNALTSLNGLDNLTFIWGNLDISGNGVLTSLSGLDNLTSIWGYLDISGNGVLTSLNGLNNIADASITDLTITNNSSLSTCEVQSICHYLAAPNGFIQIYGNAFGCNSQEEVEEACSMYCLPQGITFTTQAQIDNFQTNYSGCIEIEGNVAIQGSNITNLNGLNVLTSIGGYLDINDNDALISLSGLDNLNSIGGYLDISGNGVLTSLSGLDNLTSIGGPF